MLKERLNTIAMQLATLQAACHIVPDGAQTAASMQVSIEQAMSELEEPAPVDPLQVQLDRIAAGVDQVHTALAFMRNTAPADTSSSSSTTVATAPAAA